LEFGIVSAAMIVINFSEIFTELGLGSAMVQRENLERRHLDTAFAFSISFSCLIGILIWFTSPLIAAFFKVEQMETVLKVLAFLFPIRGLGMVAEALAQREMRFRWLAARDAISFAIGYLGFGVGLAVLGYGVWALVVAHLVISFTRSALLISAYPPKGFFPDKQSARELFYFGGGHTIARITSFLALQGDNLVVARTLDFVALGLYGRAYQLMSVPASVFGQILDRVLFPTMAQMQTKLDRLSATYLRGVGLIALVMIPTSVVGFIVAPELVGVLLGNNWSDVVLPFRILIIGLLMRTSYKISDSLARATGAVYRRAWRQMIYAGSVFAGAIIGHFWGIAGVATGVLAAVTINFLFMADLSLTIVGKAWRDFFGAHKNAIRLGLTVGIVIYPLVTFFRASNFHPLALLFAVGIVTGALVIVTLRFAPQFFFGEDGVWMFGMLKNYVRASFGKDVPGVTDFETPKQHGVVNAATESV
jgi:PST family polysaccharide transporter